MDWGFMGFVTPVPMIDGPRVEQGIDSIYGYAIIACAALCPIVSLGGLRGIAFTSILAIAGGLAMLTWAYTWRSQAWEGVPGIVEGDTIGRSSLLIEPAAFVPVLGLGLIGGASLIALGMILGRWERDD
jgi:hypothetical protein